MPEDLPRQILAMQMTMTPARHVNRETSEVRMIYNVTGGSFTGIGMAGEVMPTTGDWVTVKGASITLDVRLRLRTNEGADILLTYDKITGLEPRIRDIVHDLPEFNMGGHHFAFHPVLQTRSEGLKWLEAENLFAVGFRMGETVRYYIYQDAA